MAFISVLTLLIHWTGASPVYRVGWLLRGNAGHGPVRSVCSESPTQFYAEDVTHPHHPVRPSPPVVFIVHWRVLCQPRQSIKVWTRGTEETVRSQVGLVYPCQAFVTSAGIVGPYLQKRSLGVAFPVRLWLVQTQLESYMLGG
jgi:hypothetical protein